MKTWHFVLLMVVLVLCIVSTAAAQAPNTSKVVPKYDVATEVTLKGTVVEVSDRNCPVSGTMGFHFLLKLADGKTIEAHVAASKFIKAYDLGVNKGDEVEVIGSKVVFEGVETIFVRQVTRGNESFVFRDKAGKPLW